jgi:hypothetical protein
LAVGEEYPGQPPSEALPSEQGSELPPEVAEFYDALAPHGAWFQLPDLGWVWQPSPAEVGADFAPYRNGHWVATDVGWTWVSDFDWGWAPFHYGRWYQDARYGWVWQPGTDWAPAWVDWREGAGYVGWAPLPPGGEYAPSDDYAWSFVEDPYFLAPNLPSLVIVGHRFRHFHETRPLRDRHTVGRTHVFSGPSVGRIEARTGTPIRAVPVAHLQGQRRLWAPRLAPSVPGHRAAPARTAPPPHIVTPGRPQAVHPGGEAAQPRATSHATPRAAPPPGRPANAPAARPAPHVAPPHVAAPPAPAPLPAAPAPHVAAPAPRAAPPAPAPHIAAPPHAAPPAPAPHIAAPPHAAPPAPAPHVAAPPASHGAAGGIHGGGGGRH